MVKYNAFKPANEKNVPENLKLMDFLYGWWRRNQVAFIVPNVRYKTFKSWKRHYCKSNDKSASVIDMQSIKLALAMVVIGNWAEKLLMSKEPILTDTFNNAKKSYM